MRVRVRVGLRVRLGLGRGLGLSLGLGLLLGLGQGLGLQVCACAAARARASEGSPTGWWLGLRVPVRVLLHACQELRSAHRRRRPGLARQKPSSRRLIAWSSLFSIACSCPFSLPEPVPARAQSAMGSARLRAHAATHGCWHGLLARTTGVHAPPFDFLSDSLNASRSASFSLSSRSRYSSRRAASWSTAVASATDPAAG